MLAKNVNDNAGILDKRVACGFFASKLAPTGIRASPAPNGMFVWPIAPNPRGCGKLRGYKSE
ncbi:hypothetical protein CRN80_17640 [Pseudomonas sp. FDAARGOS_380]|nr:hypothetical protein CRN80_17640 [Pseudomonas sp. FDAARGOS_380]